MVKYIEKGDIFQLAGVTNFAHGCNCAGAMGKGIAVSFKNRFPAMYNEYKELCKNGKFKPGDVFDYNYGKGHIYNLGTQQTWRTKACIAYIEQSLVRMIELASFEGVHKIAMPAIGAGLGGLNWFDVKNVIDQIAGTNPNVELYVVEKYESEKIQI